MADSALDLVSVPETAKRYAGVTPAAYYKWANEGIVPKPIKFGRTKSGVPKHETDRVLAAMISGADKSARRDLVSKIHARREQSVETICEMVTA